MNMSGSIVRLVPLLVAAFPLAAQSRIYSRVTGAEMTEILRQEGYAPELSKDGSGDPAIKFSMEGTRCVLVFFSCKEQSCESFQYAAGWAVKDKPAIDLINAWNAKKRFGRAYLDNDRDPRLEMDIDLDGGVTGEYLKATIQTWRAVLIAFRRSLSEQKLN
jgi:hypothetical protein